MHFVQIDDPARPSIDRAGAPRRVDAEAGTGSARAGVCDHSGSRTTGEGRFSATAPANTTVPYQATIDNFTVRKNRKGIVCDTEISWPHPSNITITGNTTKTGTAQRPENIRRGALHKACDAARLEHIGFHAFRHTAITRWFLGGVDAKRVQVMAGHHSVAFTTPG